MSTVFIAGGNGQVGSRITKLLLQEGFKVTVLVRDNAESIRTSEPLVALGAHIVKGDLSQKGSLEKVLENLSPEIYIATAASLSESFIPGYEEMLKRAKATGARQFIYTNNIPRIEPLLPMFARKEDLVQLILNQDVPYTILDCEVFANYCVDAMFETSRLYGQPVTFFSRTSDIAGTGRHYVVDEYKFIPQVVLAAIGNEKAYNQRFIVAGSEYVSLRDLLRIYNERNNVNIPFQVSSAPVLPYITEDVFNILDQLDRYESKKDGQEVSEVLGVPQISLEETVFRPAN